MSFLFFLSKVFQEDGVKFGVVDNGGHFESANFVDAGVEQVIQLPFDIRGGLLLAPVAARDGDEGDAPCAGVVRTLAGQAVGRVGLDLLVGPLEVPGAGLEDHV